MQNSRLSRRTFLSNTALLAGALALPARVFADATASGYAAAKAAIAESPLVYVSPLGKDGAESSCHGEVWFVPDGQDLLVVTDPERWRARSILQGRDRARVWVGDFGVWKQAKGAFRSAPAYVAKGSIDGDPAVHARALEAFGSKYPGEWSKWGPRFESGLASGSRVLIRYAPAS